ncbi:MAG TPA: BatA and WFA domain-containing protein [Flavobacterium sp.]|jgi:hypothetical protein
MQFKHPEILYFLFLLVIPIIVHLFQLRRFKKEYFTNVSFLKELSIQTRKSSKVKKWLLLATRLLLLAAIILAFAQPFYQAKDSNNVTNEMFIVLDNSYSMQAKGNKGELLKRAVEDLLQHTPEGQSFSLLTATESYWNTDIKSVQRDLQQLQYSPSRFDLSAMMAKVKSRKSPFRKDVIIITDGVGLDQKQLESADAQLNPLFIIPEAEQKNNISIDSAFIIQTLDNFYEVGITLSRYGDTNEAPVALYNNDKLIAKTSATFKGKQLNLKFMIPKEDFHGYASVTDNGLEHDNKFYFSIQKPGKTNVLSIGESENSAFLAKIYTPDEFRYSNYTLSALNYNSLQNQDAIIVNQLTEIPQALQTTLKAFVEKGGNLVVIPAAGGLVTNLNSFIANFGRIRFSGEQKSQKLITKIAFAHPLYSGVFEKKITNFQYPSTQSSFTMGGNAPAILAYEDGSAFLTSIQNPVSSVYVFAAPLDKGNSNFKNSPLIVPTFYNMAQSASKTGVSAITIGSGQSLFINATLSKDEIVNIRRRDGEHDEKFIPVQQILSNKIKLDFNDYPQQAGNFSVYKQDQPLQNISFNYSRTEGNLDQVVDLPEQYQQAKSVEAVFDKLQSDRTSNEIWKLFVILALLFLVTELLIQKFVK